MNKTFRVEWRETLYYEDEIEAASYDEALNAFKSMWFDVGTDIEPYDSETHRMLLIPLEVHSD